MINFFKRVAMLRKFLANGVLLLSLVTEINKHRAYLLAARVPATDLRVAALACTIKPRATH